MTASGWLDQDLGQLMNPGTAAAQAQMAALGEVRRLGPQITWNNLAAELSIDHPATVADYLICPAGWMSSPLSRRSARTAWRRPP